MAETTRARINGYLADAIAEEQSFADSVRRFQESMSGGSAQAISDSIDEHARDHATRLQELLHARGGTVSAAKSTLAHILTAAPRAPELFENSDEKIVRRFGLTLSTLAAHSGMYEALVEAASVTRDNDVSSLVGSIRSEELADLDLQRSSLTEFAAPLLRSDLSKVKSPTDVVCLHLDAAIATQRSIESQLQTFAESAGDAPAASILKEYAQETRGQFEQLTRRLESLGREPSLLKGFLSQVFNFVPKLAEVGHDPSEAVVQHLIAAYGFAHADLAALATLRLAAELARDETTAALAGALEEQHQALLPRIWAEIGPAAQVSMGTMPYAASQ